MRQFLLCSALILLAADLALAQTSALNNASVSGPFFFRQLQFTSDIYGNISDCRGALGTMTFDGAGHYAINAQQTVNTLAATPLSGNGTYSIDAAGNMRIGNPQRNSLFINARAGTEAIVGSTTESGDNTFDLFIAIPAATSAQASANFTGTYYVSTLEFPLGVGTYVRGAFFNLTPGSNGVFTQLAGVGHALNVNSGQLANLSLTGATYTLNGDGTATANLGSVNSFVSGVKNLLVSASGNIVLGGSIIAGTQDFLVGVKTYSGAAALANWTGLFYTGGLRYDSRNVSSAGYVGSANAVPSLAVAATYQREHQLSASGAAFDFTGYSAVTLNTTGTYSNGGLNIVGLGPSGTSFVDADVASLEYPAAFSLDFGIAADSLSGTGVYVNPLGVLNAASLSPAGAPIAPGEFITIFGSGLAASQTVGASPFPTSLGGVTVSINSTPAPIYLVSPNQLNVLVPYSVAGSTATIVVSNNGKTSNSVVVPLSTTAPGVFTTNSSGAGAGAILHASNNSLVTSSNPAKLGENVSVYLTGLGAVSPSVSDGSPGLSNPTSAVTESVAVLVGNLNATISYAGLAPGLPGVYQINFQIPSNLQGSGNIGLAIQTAEAFAEQATIAIK